MKKIVSLALVLALALTVKIAKADFTFGEPINIGPPISTEAVDGCPVFTADGLLARIFHKGIEFYRCL